MELQLIVEEEERAGPDSGADRHEEPLQLSWSPATCWPSLQQFPSQASWKGRHRGWCRVRLDHRDRSPCFVDSLFKAWGGRGGLSFNEVVEISSYFKLILYFHIASREGGLSFSELVKIDGNLGKIVFGVHGQFPF